jgi:spore germination protein GerM
MMDGGSAREAGSAAGRLASLLVILMVPLAIALLVSSCAGRDEAPPGEPPAEAEPAAEEFPSEPAADEDEEKPPAVRDALVLFASGEDDLLYAQRRRIYWTAGVEDRAKQVLAELIAGPREGLLPVLPPGVRVREFYLLPDGTAFADFSREIRDHPAGTTSEMMAVYSIVDTLALNFPEVNRVGILVEGEEVDTLAGHIDLRYPFPPLGSVLDPKLARRLRSR